MWAGSIPSQGFWLQNPCLVWRQTQLSPASTAEPPVQTRSPSLSKLTFNVNIARISVQEVGH